MNSKQFKIALEIGGNEWWLDGVSHQFIGHNLNNYRHLIIDMDEKIYLVSSQSNYWEIIHHKNEKFFCPLEKAKKIMMLEKFK